MLGVLVLVVLLVGSVVFSIMTAVSAGRFPHWAFQQTGSSKFVWVALPLILLLFCWPAAAVMSLIWYSSKREVIERAARAGWQAPPGYGGPPYGYGAPQPGWGPPPGAAGPGGWSPPQSGPPQYPPPPQQYPPQQYPPPPPPAPGPPPQ
jgi:hypothetical protein